MDEISSKSSLSGLAYYLSEAKLLEKETAIQALQQATQNKVSYIDFLIKQKLLDSAKVAKVTAEYFGLPLCDIRAFNLDLIPVEFMNIQLVRKRLALPIFVKKGFLYLVVSDPTIENLYDVRFLTGHDIRLLVGDPVQLTLAIDELHNTLIASELDGSSIDKNENINANAHKEEAAEIVTYDAESAPVVNYVNKIILDGIEKSASDIHFERYENDYRIRYRLNGVLYPIATPPLKLASYLLSRIKIMSSLDITEHRLPQDGRFKMTLSKNKMVDFRVSVCPTLYGEKIVLRVLDSAQVFHDLDKLGMEALQKERLMHALGNTQGMILVTGPTGSGKSVTLYSALNYLNSPDDNIMTVEDPVEIPLHGVNQVHVNPKVGLTFASALRAFLRQDPDIIMIGEIRDLETAEIAIKASQTGHLVLSTLHTNSGPETITRLMNMGIEPFNLASSLILVIAQRLLRVLCNSCKQIDEMPEDILIKEGFKKEEISSLKIYKAVGCERCVQGYTGRVAIFEVMPITNEMQYMIMRGPNAIELTELAKKENVMSLRDSGLLKVKQGVSSLSELNRTFR
ncbi:MAG: type IV-A pilus assembly ATPase PilB [Gammaproteobacteria bacterium]|nr:type IV-A pilus assembly ATPase PilB [Gammaproteobacteria bacterium]